MEQTLKRLVGGVLALLVVLSLSGCEKPHGRILKKQIAALNSYADEYESNPKSEKLAKIDARLEELSKKMEALEKPSKELQEELNTKYGEEIKSAMQRYFKAKMQGQVQEAGKLFKDLGEAFQKGLE